ncbi:TPA: hypothetical protein EYP44_05055, partial [Candidatus Bathyarchaeota archaeon]|nr:hypothetical protein [Candidatus Bathyarchaeota archaeon]
MSGFERKPVLVKAAKPYGVSIRMKTRILRGMFRQVTAVEDDAHVLVRYEDGETGAWSTAHIEVLVPSRLARHENHRDQRGDGAHRGGWERLP